MAMRQMFMSSVGLVVSLSGFALEPAKSREFLPDPCQERTCVEVCPEPGNPWNSKDQWCSENCGDESHSECTEPGPEDDCDGTYQGCYSL
jgi:hypothetical protein